MIVESAVHFMAESIAILAHEDQEVWITNPKAGCTMEMLAKDHMVLPVVDQLRERYGDDLLVVAYMNTSGRLKAIAGETGGAVCTSSNAGKVLAWALEQGKRVLFVPDHHLGRNTAHALGVPAEDLLQLPDPSRGAIRLEDADGGLEAVDRARILLWGSQCGVHTIFTAAMVEHWRANGWRVLVHPESPLEAVVAADGNGSTAYLWDAVLRAEPGDRLAIGTEGHFVENARILGAAKGVEIRHLADVPGFANPGYRGPPRLPRGRPGRGRTGPRGLAGVADGVGERG